MTEAHADSGSPERQDWVGRTGSSLGKMPGYGPELRLCHQRGQGLTWGRGASRQPWGRTNSIVTDTQAGEPRWGGRRGGWLVWQKRVGPGRAGGRRQAGNGRRVQPSRSPTRQGKVGPGARRQPLPAWSSLALTSSARVPAPPPGATTLHINLPSAAPCTPTPASQKGARAHTSPSWDTSRWKQNKSCFHVGSPEEPDAAPQGGLNRAPHLALRLRTRHRRGTQPAPPQLDGGSATRGHRFPAAIEARPSPRRRLPHPSVITPQASSSPTQSLREGCSWAS